MRCEWWLRKLTTAPSVSSAICPRLMAWISMRLAFNSLRPWTVANYWPALLPLQRQRRSVHRRSDHTRKQSFWQWPRRTVRKNLSTFAVRCGTYGKKNLYGPPRGHFAIGPEDEWFTASMHRES